jgi:adenosine/AMP kinase
LIRTDGNDDALIALATKNMQKIAAGHSFIIFIENAYPTNILPWLRNVPEIVSLFCATANPTQVVIAKSAQGRGILGVIDGGASKGVEGPEDKAERIKLLRTFGYKRGG